MMSLARTLMGVVLLLAAASVRALGPPNGTAGMLDFRYPDYIVEPLVDCPFEGFFPQPRNNGWFYRCYKHYIYGYFWRAYFQCPPCTVFSDALDQCVFQETGSQCLPPVGSCQTTLADCRLIRICNFGNSNCADPAPVELCFKTTLQCPGQPNKPLCGDGFVYDKTNKLCRVAPKPTDVNDDIDNFFVCELAGSRPSAEGYRTLGCSERQFCNNNGSQLAPITSCQWYLECDFTAPGGLQLVPKQCPAGQFFFYGSVKQCGGKGQLGLYDCPSSSTTTTATNTTTTAPPESTDPGQDISSEDCTFEGETLGIEQRPVKHWCRRSCEANDESLDSYRYCPVFFQCWKAQSGSLGSMLMDCPERNYGFDRINSTCIQMTYMEDCVKLDSPISAPVQCSYPGQLPVNYPELPCDVPTQCSDGSLSGGGCQTFNQCMDPHIGSGPLEIRPQVCANSAMKFDKKTQRCVVPPACNGTING